MKTARSICMKVLSNDIEMIDIAFVLYAFIPIAIFLIFVFYTWFAWFALPLIFYWLFKVFVAYGKYLEGYQDMNE